MRHLALLGLALGFASMAPAYSQNTYVQTNLVANTPAYAPQIVDPNLVDAWGLALRPPGAGGHIWISNGGTGTSSEFIGDVNGIPLHQDGLKSVNLDTAGFADRGFAFVTGQVYNAASDFAGQPIEFPVSGSAHDLSTTPATPLGTISGAAKFAFVTEDGAINAWRSSTAAAMDSAPVVVDYTKTAPHFPYGANSVFTGVAMTVNAYTSARYIDAGGNHLFSTDFRNNAIEVFDNQWRDVTSTYHFQTPVTVGSLSPFNIQDIGGHLFVAYAEFNPAGDEGFEQITGPGLGHLVEYNEDGTLAQDFQDTGKLDSPWGVAIAPATFGRFANDVLVGNFGDGTIAAFDPATGAFLDDVRGTDGNPIAIDGVWALGFGNGVSLGDANSLYFTAGPESQQDGLFGKITVVPEPGVLAMGMLGAFGVLGLMRPRGKRSPLLTGRVENHVARVG